MIAICGLTLLLSFSILPPTLHGQVAPGTTFSGPSPWIDVKAYGAKGDGTTDDTASIQNAIGACPTSGNLGCTVFFPLGAYKITGTGLSVAYTQQGVTLKGQCGVLGVGMSCSRLTSGQTGISILSVGNGSTIHEGLQITDLEFNDASGTGAVAGAIKLNLVEHFSISGVYCQNFTGGYCIGAIGGGGAAFTQFGVITNLTTSNTKFPIQTSGKTSSINLYGGDITCGLLNAGVGSIGMDIGFTNHFTTDNVGGEWGAFGTHIKNCDTGIALVDSSAFQGYVILEQTASPFTSTGSAVTIGATGVPVSPHTRGSIVSGTISQFANGVVLGAGVEPVTISATYNGVATPTSASDATSLAKAVILSPNQGAQLPLDLTISGEAAPSVSTSGSGKLYFDSSANVFKASRNGAAFGFEAFAASSLAAGHIVQGNGNGDLADNGYTIVATGSGAGSGPSNQGTATSLARSDHDHRSVQALTWFFNGAQGTSGVRTYVLTLPDGAMNIAGLDFRVVADTTSSSASTYNIQRCTANCTGTMPTFSDIYSTALTLSANTRTVSKGSAPDQNNTFSAGDQFKVSVVSGASGLQNLTVILTYKCATSN